MKDTNSPGTLYVVATPIGNLEDITARALRILSEADLIACEDTRHTRKLLNHFQIATPLTSYYREKEQHKTTILLRELQEGKSIALVSDAGTPAISDPGSVLVAAAREAGIETVPIPGPAALTTALSVSGITDTAFFFGGFPPAKRGERKRLFQQLAALTCPLIFYESPHRIKNSLSDCLEILGERRGMLLRELTKIHEESLTGTISDLLDRLPQKVKGEFVFIVFPSATSTENKPENLDDLLQWYRDQPDISLKDAVSRIAADLDLSRSMVYKKALKIWNKQP